MAANVIFAALSLILNCPGLKLTIAIYRGLPIWRPLPYIPYCDGARARYLLYLTNQDFPSPGWKIAIGPLTTSALAALATCPPIAPERFLFFFFSLA